MEIDNNKWKKCIHFRYRRNIWFYCGLISIVVIFLAFYNHAKIKEYKNKQTKLDSVLAKQDSIKLETDKEKVLKLQKMNQQIEKQTDTLSSQLSILDKDMKTLKEVLDSTIIKEKKCLILQIIHIVVCCLLLLQYLALLIPR